MTGGTWAPPVLDGFTLLSHLGGGGFADVYLYEQHLPERRVAVKVLRETVDDDGARRQFEAEANLMARVSTHPNIVTIHHAAVSTDRRPYLVMEYYPPPHFGDRIRQGQMPVHEVLSTGIKIASAVETAHRAHIIHRDIKPANILVSEFGAPGLTDFGISGTQIGAAIDDSMGFSPPYAPPEIILDEHPGDERSDVYSLAATLWAMLAGHSPYELPDRSLPRSEIMSRALNTPVPRLPRDDVPPSLENVLQHALSKDAAARPGSARSLALSLQSVEQELGYSPTPLDLPEQPQQRHSAAPPSLDGERTKLGRGKVVRPQAPLAPPAPATGAAGLVTDVPGAMPGGSTVPSASGRGEIGAAAPIERLAMPVAPDEPGTIKVKRPAAPVATPGDDEAASTRNKWLAIGAAAVLVVVAAVVVFVAAGGSGTASRPTDPTLPVDAQGTVFGPAAPTVDAVTNIAATTDGTVVHFTWDGAVTTGEASAVRYIVARVDDGAGATPTSTIVDAPGFDAVLADGAASACISVQAYIAGVAEAPTPAPTKCSAG